ncbi:MAG TPA: DinB family protein [Dehalococcoidia bacterium]|nr:DinB family protein [Dehalococcoidia bacterium]
MERANASSEGLAPGTLAALAAAPAVFEALFAGQPDAALERRGVEGWSAKDVLAHLVSIQPLTLVERVRAMVEGDVPSLPDIDEHVTLERSGLRDRPAPELVAKFTEERAQAMVFLDSLTQDQLRRRGRHEVAGEISAADAIHHVAYHDLLHIAQAANLLAEPIERSRGAMRTAFPI